MSGKNRELPQRASSRRADADELLRTLTFESRVIRAHHGAALVGPVCVNADILNLPKPHLLWRRAVKLNGPPNGSFTAQLQPSPTSYSGRVAQLAEQLTLNQ